MRLKGKQKPATAPCKVEDGYAAYVFIPLLRRKDADLFPELVANAFTRLQSWKAHSPRKWNDCAVTSRYMAMVEEVCKKFWLEGLADSIDNAAKGRVLRQSASDEAPPASTKVEV